MRPRVAVTFAPSGAVAWVEAGTTVLQAARAAGVLVPAACGSRGVCGSCGIRLIEGELAPAGEAERDALARAPVGVRLACRAVVEGPVVVQPLLTAHLPEASRLPAASVEAAGGDRLVAAVDLGTTTVAAGVVTASGGRQVGASIVANSQQAWGADVLSRVAAAVGGDHEQLRNAAVDSVRRSLEHAGLASFDRLERVVIAGNTAMSALFSDVSVVSLASHPFEPPKYPTSRDASEVAPSLAGAELVVLPPIAGFVGGDALAGLIHTGMLWASSAELLVDFGTNAEIALAHEGRLWVASAAAGPAFEGVGIECGMSAGSGAVVAVGLSDSGELELETIGGGESLGIAGTGAVSLGALLLRLGHLTPEGLMVAEGPLAERFARGEDGVMRFRLSGNEDVSELALSQRDVRTLQLAKAAVRAGVEQVLRAAGVAASALRSVHVAGAFGSALAPQDLLELGVLPKSVGGRVAPVGNASLGGALAVALEPGLLAEASDRARGSVHVDLAASADFNRALIGALALEPFDA